MIPPSMLGAPRSARPNPMAGGCADAAVTPIPRPSPTCGCCAASGPPIGSPTNRTAPRKPPLSGPIAGGSAGSAANAPSASSRPWPSANRPAVSSTSPAVSARRCAASPRPAGTLRALMLIPRPSLSIGKAASGRASASSKPWKSVTISTSSTSPTPSISSPTRWSSYVKSGGIWPRTGCSAWCWPTSPPRWIPACPAMPTASFPPPHRCGTPWPWPGSAPCYAGLFRAASTSPRVPRRRFRRQRSIPSSSAGCTAPRRCATP